MTQFQLEKQQIRDLLGVKKVPSDLTLKDLATKVSVAISISEDPSRYSTVLGACVSVIRYLEQCSEARYNFIKTLKGRKALATLAQIARQRRGPDNLSQIFDYKY